MNSSQIYTLISIIALAGIIVTFILTRKKTRKLLTPLAGLTFAFIIVGFIFGESRLISYGLMGVGVILVVIDIISKLKTKN